MSDKPGPFFFIAVVISFVLAVTTVMALGPWAALLGISSGGALGWMAAEADNSWRTRR